MLRSDTIGCAFRDELFPRFESSFDKITYALMRLSRFKARVDKIFKALLSIGKLRDSRYYAALDPKKIHKIIAFLTPGHDGSTTRSRISGWNIA
jgi:hypothetical protein